MNIKDIAGYEGLYAITESGEVWSYKRHKFLKLACNSHGYLQVNLYKDGKRKYMLIHRLVASVYIPNPDPENLTQVNHKDEVKTNNWIWNLEWCNSKYNNNFGTRKERAAKSMTNHPKLSHRIKCLETGEVFESLMDCQRKTGCSNGNLSKHLKGHQKHKTVKGFHFILCESS